MAITKNELLEAFRAVVSSEFDHIPKNEDEIEYSFSARFMKRMMRLFRRQKKVYWKYVNTAAKRVAVIFVSVLVLFATACSIKPIREPIIRFITEVYETFTAYFFQGDTTEDVIEKAYALDPVPEGLVEVSRVENDTVIITKYENKSGDIIVVTQSIVTESLLLLDTEKEGITKEIIDGIEVMIYDYESKKQAMFIKDSYYFQIVCIGDVDIELVKQIIVDLK